MRLRYDSSETPSLLLPPVARPTLPPLAPRAHTTPPIPHPRPLAPLATHPPTAEDTILRPEDPALIAVVRHDITTRVTLLRRLRPGAD